MTIYLSTFLLIMCISLFSRNNITYAKKRIDKSKIFLIITCVILSFIEGVRAINIGTDTNDYVISFVQLDFKFDEYEVLSKLLVLFVRMFTHNPTIYLLICSLLINGLIFIAVYRMSENVHYSVFVFISLLFYFTSFNAIRQACAYAVILNGFYYIREKKYLKYAATVVVAALFHTSAIIGLSYLLIPIIKGWKKKHKKTNKNNSFWNRPALKSIIVVLLTVICSYIAYSRFNIIMDSVVGFLPKYEVYLYNIYSTMVGGIQQPIVYTAIFICFVMVVPNDAEYKTDYLIPLSIAVIFAFASLKMAYIARFMYYFDITTIISIPYMINHNKFSKLSRKFFSWVIICICIAFLIYGLMNNYMRVTNYQFVWK